MSLLLDPLTGACIVVSDGDSGSFFTVGYMSPFEVNLS